MRIPFWTGPGRKRREDIFALGSEDPFFLEQFKALRAKFEYKVDMFRQKVVAVTSAVAGEGKTILCGRLALNLALAGRKKVLLVDVDLRKSDLARGLNITPMPGLTEFLSGSVKRNDIVRNSLQPGLYVIPAGTTVTTGGELLSGEKFRSFLKEIRADFDVILLDTPPILPVADTLSLRDQVDSFIFLYRAGFTPHTLFRQAVEEVGDKNVLGVVINGVEPKAHRYYQRYYGKYYQRKPESESGKSTPGT